MDLNDVVVDMSELIWFVKNRSGVDLSRYRPSCLRRRVAHRMAVVGCGSLEEYIGHLASDKEELSSLVDVVTIHVTEFYRDYEVFEALECKYIPTLIYEKTMSGNGNIRVWSAGCSTGEEAYSIAMMLHRVAMRIAPDVSIEVFGTDVSDDACRIARKGIYSREKIENLPKRIRNEYFEKKGDSWHICGDLRNIVKFRPHDLFTTPLYSLLDLIVCRNVLIHFEHPGRDNIIRSFNESLGRRGLLVLGKSEAISGEMEELFDLEEPRCKIYRKKQGGDRPKED
jgi:chemotaxis methyl-accepting protein methylase